MVSELGEIKTKPTRALCLVCKTGKIVEKFVFKFVGPGLPIDGPGSESQYSWVSHGLHCEGCGVKYEHLPFTKKAYCTWGKHYIDPADAFNLDYPVVCKACQKIIDESTKKISIFKAPSS